MPKWTLANSMDLYLYPRLFEPLFRGFFGKAARFFSRQSVEFRPTFLLVLPNTHSKHRCRCVSPLCDVSDVKTAGKPPPAPGRNYSVLAMLGREKAKHPLPVQRVVVYLLALSRASVFNVTPIMSLWASRVRPGELFVFADRRRSRDGLPRTVPPRCRARRTQARKTDLRGRRCRLRSVLL